MLGSPLINRISFLVSLIDFVIGELRQRNERLSIGVITFYARQKELLEEEMKRLGHADAVLVKTVDAFQVRKKVYWDIQGKYVIYIYVCTLTYCYLWFYYFRARSVT